MANQILSTKLFAPESGPNIILRTRLQQRMQAGPARPMMLVSAPAGYGKTTMLSDWVRNVDIPFAWLSLDKADNDEIRFWTHFVAALRLLPGQWEAKIGEDALAYLASDDITSQDSMQQSLLSELAMIKSPHCLVLDDFHMLTDPAILDGLFYLVENLPAGMSGLQFVISTRSDPPWPLARIRTAGRLLELRAKDLRFNLEETLAFFGQDSPLKLSIEEAIELEKRTEGWAAGLQMAALSLQDNRTVDEFLSDFSGSNRFVLDFLLEEVLNRQTPEFLDFLLKTSVLQRLSGDLCSAVTGQENGSELLMQLEKANMFLVALDDQRLWYRYHQLFADLLRKQLATRFPDDVPLLHRRAAKWFAKQGLGHEAIEHAFKTGDVNFAVAQIEAFVLTTHQRSELIFLRKWLASLPDAIIDSRPLLCVALAWIFATPKAVDRADEFLTKAVSGVNIDTAQGEAFDSEIVDYVNRQAAILQVVIARLLGKPTETQQEMAFEALENIPAKDHSSRADLFLRLGFSYLDKGQDNQADENFKKANELGKSGANPYAAQAAVYGRMVVARRKGHLNVLESICLGELNEYQVGSKEKHPLLGIPLAMHGMLLYERNKLDEARPLLNEALALLETARIIELQVKGRFALACLDIGQGQNNELPDLRQIAMSGNSSLKTYAEAMQVRLQLLAGGSGNTKEASRWARKQLLRILKDSSYDWELFEKLVYTRVLLHEMRKGPSEIARRRIEAALAFLDAQRTRLEALGWWGFLVELEVVYALGCSLLGRTSDAFDSMAVALDFGAREGFVRLFVDEGAAMRALLKSVRVIGDGEVFVRGLMLAFGETKVISETALLEPLSVREEQVLQLLNTSLSVPEIASELHLSPTTVRTHVQHIYQKLGVHGRLEALARAEEIQLLRSA